MEGILNVTPEVLQSTAGDFQAKATQVKSLHDAMLNRVRSLSGTWAGTASDAYVSKFNSLENSMQTIYRMITEHVRDLNEMAEQYMSAESTATSAAENLPVSTLD